MTAIPYLFNPGKSPSDRRSYGFDFGSQPEFMRSSTNPTAQTIVDYSTACINNDDTLVLEDAILSGNPNNPTVVSSYINGGTAGTVYQITFQALTNLDVNIVRTVLLPVNDL